MSSFFKAKKPSPPNTTGDPGAAQTADDFIFIERSVASAKPNVDVVREPSPMFPVKSELFPAIPGPLAKGPAVRKYSHENYDHYIRFVPFKLPPELCVDDLNELSRLQMYDVLSYITQILYSVKHQYDFRLEKRVLNDTAK
ncbi:uncharacterized protein LOC131271634 [Anopheles coustani]|uniref:uncharacterized protein LOC131271634 n=1 Tax=Anopheles coustani TaxID=139045 RepID=UPI002657B5F4|nr:uncharacterized protein LOC131271634 [Anopheles coustani]